MKDNCSSQTDQKKALVSKIGLSALWLLFIWTLSSLPSDDLPGIQIISADKLAHIGVYLVLGLLVNNCLKHAKSGVTGINLVYALLLLNAALDEAHQKYIPGRSVSVYDLMANTLGLAFAWGILRRWIAKNVKEREGL